MSCFSFTCFSVKLFCEWVGCFVWCGCFVSGLAVWCGVAVLCGVAVMSVVWLYGEDEEEIKDRMKRMKSKLRLD